MPCAQLSFLVEGDLHDAYARQALAMAYRPVVTLAALVAEGHDLRGPDLPQDFEHRPSSRHPGRTDLGFAVGLDEENLFCGHLLSGGKALVRKLDFEDGSLFGSVLLPAGANYCSHIPPIYSPPTGCPTRYCRTLRTRLGPFRDGEAVFDPAIRGLPEPRGFNRGEQVVGQS
ncbi:protein of unknown function [Methylacidimicrobium sp. AP8]|nr:protein of unknown function [Methylacidimicrobium sp. AP8]